jgi:hypothetical protein
MYYAMLYLEWHQGIYLRVCQCSHSGDLPLKKIFPGPKHLVLSEFIHSVKAYYLDWVLKPSVRDKGMVN